MVEVKILFVRSLFFYKIYIVCNEIRIGSRARIFIHVLISLAILLFAAKIFAELFNKLKLPAVLGELLAGIIVGPFALGSLPLLMDNPLSY